MNSPTLTQEKIDAALDAVVEEYGVPLDDLASRKRDPVTCEARMLYFFLLRVASDGGDTLNRIGDTLGKDHGTVCFSIRKTVLWLKTYPALRDRYNRIVTGYLERTTP